MARGDALALVTVTICAALAVPELCGEKCRLAGESWIEGGDVAVPDSVTTCGLPAALSVKARVADFAPTASVGDGPNRTLTLQLACTATLPPPVHWPAPEFATVKSAASAPPIDMLTMFSAMLPVFNRVTCCVPD